ncbi:pyrroline-5-carboxylate reductase [Bacillus sp. FJAT-47783]|uniref:pyrroline-5-carboxylate reductase n=1 Tax=Bacillus sp. FJAT-47783 TaxID=2922712 RepID=UPI001FADDE5E|nr:pyrroline-5-carboxylate reductase [Bacillus sp. FJAT-47783]
MKTIGFIGAGSMAEAFISGLINGGIYKPEHIYVSNKTNEERLEQLHAKYRIHMAENKEEIIQKADVIILAIKPKGAETVIRAIQPFVTEDHLIISVLAGVSTTAIEEILVKKVPVIRAMPNTSATIRLSATGMTKGHYTTEEQLAFAKGLFEAIGTVQIVKEEQLDAVTGLAGSGPAYIYYLVEALEHAAKEVGFDEETARSFIIQTLCGASEMLKQTNKEAAVLRKEVTSPGGTTEAGIKILEANGFQNAIVDCVKQAEARSKELRHAFFENMLKERV